MQLDDRLYAGQANAAAGDATFDVASAPEPFEHVRQIRFRNALAKVRDGEHGRITLNADGNLNGAAARTELQGVVHQVVQHTPKAYRIPVTHELVERGRNPQYVPIRDLLMLGDGFVREYNQVGRTAPQ